MRLGRGPVHLTEEGGRAKLGQDLLGLGASRERRSTNSSKLHIDFCLVVGSPGTSRNGIGFQLEKWKGRLSLGQEGKVRRRDARASVPQRYQGLDRGSGEVVPPLYLPLGMQVSGRWPQKLTGMTCNWGEGRRKNTTGKGSTAQSTFLPKVTQISNILPH